MTAYLVSRPGRPLHLAVWAYDRTTQQPSGYQTGRHVPLCGQDRGAEWQITGPWAEKWDRHKGSGLCFRCDVLATNLIDAAEAARRA